MKERSTSRRRFTILALNLTLLALGTGCDALSSGKPTASPAAPSPTSPTSSAAAGPSATSQPVASQPASPAAVSQPITPSPSRIYLPTLAQGAPGELAAAATAIPTPTAQPTAPLASLTPEPTRPPATPPPAPTATPRVKPPPSPYQRLQDYPRPPGDSGYGFHINAEPRVPPVETLRSQVIPLMKSLGATWVTVWASSDFDDQSEGCKLLLDSGIEVILRYHETKPPHAGYIPTIGGLQKFRAAGVRYFLTGNEPNLNIENPAKAGPDLVAQQWVQSADRIKSVGGIPLLYPMSPGGGGDVADSRVMLVAILDWLKAHDELDTLDGAGVAIHNRPMGKPLEVRDSTSFLEYEWIDDTVASYAGKHLPLFGTEAGYAFGEQVLPIYPKVDGELHKQYNLAIITGFRDGRWRDTLFTQNFWMLGGFGYQQFIADWWIANPLNYGKDLPIVEALKALPKFTRKFNAPGFQTKPRP